MFERAPITYTRALERINTSSILDEAFELASEKHPDVDEAHSFARLACSTCKASGNAALSGTTMFSLRRSFKEKGCPVGNPAYVITAQRGNGYP